MDPKQLLVMDVNLFRNLPGLRLNPRNRHGARPSHARRPSCSYSPIHRRTGNRPRMRRSSKPNQRIIRKSQLGIISFTESPGTRLTLLRRSSSSWRYPSFTLPARARSRSSSATRLRSCAFSTRMASMSGCGMCDWREAICRLTDSRPGLVDSSASFSSRSYP